MMRQQDESHKIYNYFDCSKNESYQTYLKENKGQPVLTRSQRAIAVYMMIELNLKRQYEIDTLFMAVSIMDRYLMLIGHWNFKVEDLNILACTCILVAAKLEQPQLPNYQNMIYAYEELKSEKDCEIEKDQLKEMEEKILV